MANSAPVRRRDFLSKKNLNRFYQQISVSILDNRYYVHRIVIQALNDTHLTLYLDLRDENGNNCSVTFIKVVGYGVVFIVQNYSRFKAPANSEYLEDLTVYFDNFIDNLFTIYPTAEISKIDFYPFSGQYDTVRYIKNRDESWTVELGFEDLLRRD